MTDLYLIAHKVRGEAAFDIAEKLMIGDEEGWIIPTSGHRAYPWFTQPLYEIVQEDILKNPQPPEGLRDHYEVTRDPPQAGKAKIVETIDLSELGL